MSGKDYIYYYTNKRIEKNMKKINILAVLISAIIMTSCDEDGPTSPKHSESDFVGKWLFYEVTAANESEMQVFEFSDTFHLKADNSVYYSSPGDESTSYSWGDDGSWSYISSNDSLY
ncbi:MAG: hypothetical protein Kapaf2KO_13360 [Candidatus Kapaibacteriales bacterium]